MFAENHMDWLMGLPEQMMEVMAFQPDSLIPVNIHVHVAFWLAMVFGYLLYVQAIRVVLREKVDPYPLWLHCWMITIDITGTIMSWQVAMAHDFFWVFVLLGVGLPVWVVMEAICIVKGVNDHRQEEFGDLVTGGDCSKKQAWVFVAGMVATALASNLFIESCLGGFSNWCIFLMWPLANWVFAWWTWRFWLREAAKTGKRYRNSMGLQIIICVQLLLMWVPGLSWWTYSTPYLNTPEYLLVGAAASILSFYNLYKCSRLPKKELLENGKKPIW